MVKKVTLISLSSGLMGESFVAHETEIGIRRLMEYGLQIQFTSNAMKGMQYLDEHPEARAQDWLEALRSI